MMDSSSHSKLITTPEMTASLASQLRICRIATVPITFAWMLSHQLSFLREQGVQLTLVSSPEPELIKVATSLKIPSYPIVIARQPSPYRDISALYEIVKYFRAEKFDIVHSVTPKAGLLAAVAGKIARVPIRLHTFTGQVWVERKGLFRAVLRGFDRTIASLNTYCYADSHSQRQFLIDEGLVKPDKISVLGAGSIAGVDLKRFDPDRFSISERQEMRRAWGVSNASIVILFVGRVTRDKGVEELVEAFYELLDSGKEADLFFVGSFEPDLDPLPKDTTKKIESCARIHLVGFSEEPEKYMSFADLLCLPSYREGFPNVIIQASAMGLPVIGTSIVGLTDTIEDGITGILVPPKESRDLFSALLALCNDPQRRQLLGFNGRERAMKSFDSKLVNGALVSEYQRLAREYLRC